MRQLPPRWITEPFRDPAAANRLAAELKLPAALARLLVQRGFSDIEAARSFLRPELEKLTDPYRLAGMADAVETIVRAVKGGRPILVHGDYDVDGQCASAMLTRVLRQAGAQVEAFVPHRMRDGYDFGPAGLARAKEIGAGLIVTCLTAIFLPRR